MSVDLRHGWQDRHAFILWPLLDDYEMWWACYHPERPGDCHTIYVETCEYCLLKLRADLASDFDPELREQILLHLSDNPEHECLLPPDILAMI